MFEHVGEAFRPAGCFSRATGLGHPRHRGELTHQVGRQTVFAIPHQGIQARDRGVQASERVRGIDAGPEVVELDDDTHTPILTPGSDRTQHPSPAGPPDCPQATRTLVTGARFSRVANHVPPPSGDPNTPPLVAPK